MEPRRHVSIRLTTEGRQVLVQLAQHLGLSQSGVIEMVLRGEAQRRKLPPLPPTSASTDTR